MKAKQTVDLAVSLSFFFCTYSYQAVDALVKAIDDIAPMYTK